MGVGAGCATVARLHLHESGLKVDYRQMTDEALASEAGAKFDVVSCLEMLEHVPDPAEVVRSCTDLLRPGGHVFFSTINRNPKAYLFAIIGAEYLLQMLPKGTHEWNKFITLKLENGQVKTGELAPTFWGDMKQQYEAHNKDYTGVYKGK